MKKIQLFFCLISFSSFAQNHSFEADFNVSQLQLSGQFTYRYHIGKWSIAPHLAYGQIGKDKNAVPFNDGYGAIYNSFDFSGNYTYLGYEHDFVGLKAGLGIGRNFTLSAKSELLVEVNFDYYSMVDHYKYYFSSNYTDNKEFEERWDLKYNNYSIGLGVSYYYSLSACSSLKFGIELPFLIPNNNAESRYEPGNFKQPVIGWEPYIKLGYQYTIQKKQLYEN
jgi:hypothetical protein